MNSIKQLSELVSTSVASYASLNASDLRNLLIDPDFGAGFSQTQATNFASTYSLLHQRPNTASGFSASLFENQIKGKKVFAIRGTEIPIDIVSDLVVADGLGIGRIVEQGNHDQLLKHNGYYAKLHSYQNHTPSLQTVEKIQKPIKPLERQPEQP